MEFRILKEEGRPQLWVLGPVAKALYVTQRLGRKTFLKRKLWFPLQSPAPNEGAGEAWDICSRADRPVCLHEIVEAVRDPGRGLYGVLHETPRVRAEVGGDQVTFDLTRVPGWYKPGK